MEKAYEVYAKSRKEAIESLNIMISDIEKEIEDNNKIIEFYSVKKELNLWKKISITLLLITAISCLFISGAGIAMIFAYIIVTLTLNNEYKKVSKDITEGIKKISLEELKKLVDNLEKENIEYLKAIQSYQEDKNNIQKKLNYLEEYKNIIVNDEELHIALKAMSETTKSFSNAYDQTNVVDYDKDESKNKVMVKKLENK